MAHSNEALLIIDYTNDFVADKGALTCGAAGQVLAPHIVALADEFLQQDGWVYLPTDVHTPHDPYHPESKLFPPHNVRGTWGRAFFGSLAPWYAAHKDAVAALTPAGQDWALDHFAHVLGAEVTD